jgi:hypothetical protein
MPTHWAAPCTAAATAAPPTLVGQLPAVCKRMLCSVGKRGAAVVPWWQQLCGQECIACLVCL